MTCNTTTKLDMKMKMKNMLFAGMLGIWATGAMAHSPLVGTTPANEAVVAEVPTEVLLDFKGDIRLTAVTMTHAGKHSVELDLGDQTAVTQEFALPLENLGAGEYVIAWRGLGDDGHALNGTFSFTAE